MAGVSDNENKEVVKGWINKLNPGAVLDIGAGQGTYSTLARKPHQHWTALEVFYPYVNMFDLRSKYDRIVIADAYWVDHNRLGSFDLTIAADMLEHMEKLNAKILIKRLLGHTKHLLICFPVEHQEQHAGNEGNDFETHIDHWDYEEMVEFLGSLNCKVEKSIVGNVLAYFLIDGEGHYDD